MGRPISTASQWLAMISRSTTASAPAARTARACPSASASPPCASTASPSAARADARRIFKELIFRFLASPACDATALSHHSGNAARPGTRRLDHVLEITVRGCRAIALAPIGPGAAARVTLASLGAGLAVRVGSGLEILVVAADAVDRVFEFAKPRLDDAGAAHARHAAARLHGRRDLVL